MGARTEFREMVKFVSEAKIRPIVSKKVKGLRDLNAIEGLFSDMQQGTQFGKLVIEIAEPDTSVSPKL